MKTLKIKIKNKASADLEIRKLANEIDSKKTKNKLKNGIYFESLKAVRKILTDKRLDVWRTIRDKKPESITHLAKILKREFRSVHRDILLLQDLGLIKMSEGPGKRGNVQILTSLYDELLLAVA